MEIIIKFNVFSLQHMLSAANKTKQLHFNLFTTNSNQPLVIRCCPGGFSTFVAPFLGLMSFSIIITSPLRRGIDLKRKSSIPLTLLAKLAVRLAQSAVRLAQSAVRLA